MAYDLQVKDKKCATCRWWGGSREVIFVGREPKYVRVAGILQGAPCAAWNGRSYNASATCPRWSLWEKL